MICLTYAPSSRCYNLKARIHHTCTSKYRTVAYFLSTPVHMHGGLICITFCLDVCMSGCLGLDQNSDWTKSHWIKGESMTPKLQVSHCKLLVCMLHVCELLAGVLTSTSSCLIFYSDSVTWIHWDTTRSLICKCIARLESLIHKLRLKVKLTFYGVSPLY